MAALPTLALGTFSNVAGATIVGTEPVLQVIASAVDSSYVYSGNNNTTGTYSANFALGDTPTDFGNMDTLAVRLRYLVSGTAQNTCTLSVRVFQSDGTTPLTDLVQVVADVNNTTAANSSVITLTGLNTTANKAVWDGALVRIDWGLTKVKGGDSNQRRVTAAEVTGTYTETAPAVEHTRSFAYSATGSVAFAQEEPPTLPHVTATTVDNTAGLDETTLTTSHTHPSGSNKVYVAVGIRQGITALPTIAATYNGVSMTHVFTHETVDEAAVAWFEIEHSAAGAHNGVITLGTTFRFTTFWYSAANAGAVRASAGTGGGTTPTAGPFGAGVASLAGDLILSSAHWRNSGEWTTASDGTQVDDQDVNAQNSRGAAAHFQAVAANDDIAWTWNTTSSSNTYAIATIAIQEYEEPSTPVSASFSATGSLAFSSQLALSRTWDYSATGTTSHARTAALSRAFAYAASGSAALARSAQRFLEFVFSSTGSLTRVMTRAMSLSFSATGSLVRSSQLAFTRAWDYSASGAAALAKTSILSRALAFAASGASTLARVTALNKLFSYSGTGSAANDYGLLLSHSSDATATGTSTFSRTLSRALAFSYAAAGTVSRALGVAKLLSYAATATSTASKAVSTSKVFGATGTAVASAQKVFLNAFSVAATGTVTFAQELAAGAIEYFRSLTATASAAVSLATTVVYRHSSSATALATPNVVRHLSKLLQASAIGGTALERLLNGAAIENIRIFSPPITIYALADITGKVKWVDYIPVRVENTEKRGHYDDDGCFHVVALPSVGGLREWVDYMPVHAVGSGKRWKYDDDGYIPVNEV